MKVYYWSPFTSKVATIRAVVNSIISLKKFSKNNLIPNLINVAGEWDDYLEELKEEEIKVINLTRYKFLSKNYSGYYTSRFLYILTSLISFFPLKKLLKQHKPDYFIIHLITPTPLFLNYFLNIRTKFILRISGFPQLKNNHIRYVFWKVFLKSLSFITCPTNETTKLIKSYNFIKNNRVVTVHDPILYIKKIHSITKADSKNEEKQDNKKFYLAIGRLTKQKNFKHLINSFKKLNQNKKNFLYIIGEGEEYDNLSRQINNYNLQNEILLLGYKKNIFYYLKKSKCFILSSLWEDPGFVLIEAAYFNNFIISSNCKNGPEEILNYGKNGILYKSNNDEELCKAVKKFENINELEKYKMILGLKKKTKEFTIFYHYKMLSRLLS